MRVHALVYFSKHLYDAASFWNFLNASFPSIQFLYIFNYSLHFAYSVGFFLSSFSSYVYVLGNYLGEDEDERVYVIGERNRVCVAKESNQKSWDLRTFQNHVRVGTS